MNLIIGKLKKRIELKLVKYNNILINKLNITQEDFENFKSLKEMYQKFNLDIKDIEIEELNLRSKSSCNKLLEYLKRIELKLIKYNKILINKLNITKEDFENFKTLKEMNQKFNLNIKDIEIKELYLGNIGLVYHILEYQILMY